MAAIKPIRAALAAACALAGVHADPARAVQVETAAMLYTEADRVTAFEPVLQVRHVLSDFRTFNLKLVLDGLTGASPNGAVPSRFAQTFTRPSGGSSYVTPANTLPKDETFTDKRAELGVSLEQRHGLLTRATYGLRGSAEQDYYSVAGDLIFKREFNQRNSMLTLGLSLGLDSVRPMGGAPTALAIMAEPSESEDGDKQEDEEDEGGESGGESKSLADLLVGITQILDRSTVVQLNYSLSHSGGYLTDPYKFVSVVQPADGAAPGEPVSIRYEGRPDSRLKQSLYGELKRHLGRDIAEIGYRYLWDDWGLRSHTVELCYRLRFKEGNALEPQLRWYRQTAADFYRYALIDGQPLPDFASADPRLGPFDAWTYGLKLRHRLASGHEISLRGEYYRQRGENHPAGAVGQLKEQDLFPDLDAFILVFGYSFDFLTSP